MSLLSYPLYVKMGGLLYLRSTVWYTGCSAKNHTTNRSMLQFMESPDPVKHSYASCYDTTLLCFEADEVSPSTLLSCHVSESTSDLVSFARQRTVRDTHNQQSSLFVRSSICGAVSFFLSVAEQRHHRIALSLESLE